MAIAIPIVIGAFKANSKILLRGLKELEISGRVKTSQTAF